MTTPQETAHNNQVSIRYLWFIIIMLFTLLVFVVIGYAKLHIRLAEVEHTIDTLTKPPKINAMTSI